MKKTIFLDRDNTIIEDRVYLNDPNDIVYLKDVFPAMQIFKDLDYQIIIVTNQSGIPRGLVQIENLNKIHENIARDFKEKGIDIAGFYYAPHLPDSDHHLRKPNTGMLEAADKDHPVDFKRSWMVGDRMTDVEAGHRAGCKSILMLITEGEDIESSPYKKPEAVVHTLLEAAEYIRDNS